MVPFWKCANKITGGFAILCALASCASWTPPSVKTQPEPLPYHASATHLMKVGGFAAYLSALRQNQIADDDVNQLKHIQLRELGQRIHVDTSTSRLEMPLVAAVTPRPETTPRRKKLSTRK